MNVIAKFPGIERLSVAERLEPIEEIRETIRADEATAPPDEAAECGDVHRNSNARGRWKNGSRSTPRVSPIGGRLRGTRRGGTGQAPAVARARRRIGRGVDGSAGGGMLRSMLSIAEDAHIPPAARRRCRASHSTSLTGCGDRRRIRNGWEARRRSRSSGRRMDSMAAKVTRIPAFEFTPEMQKRIDAMSARLGVAEPLDLIDRALRTLDAVAGTMRDDEHEVTIQGGAKSVRLKVKS